MTTRSLRRRPTPPEVHTPTILDDIHVCWELNGVKVWWPALVIEVFQLEHPAKDIYGKGRLLYKRFRNYSEEEADVEFVFTKRRGHLLNQQYNGVTLQMTWSTSGCHHKELPQSSSSAGKSDGRTLSSIPGKRRADPVPRPSKRGSLDKSKTEPLLLSNIRDSPDMTLHIDPDSSCQTPSSSRPNSAGTRHEPAAANLEPNRSRDEVVPGGDSAVRRSSNGDTVEVAAFQKTTSMFIENILSTSQQLMSNYATSAFHDQLSQLVMHELRIDLVNELHRHFRTPHTLQHDSSNLQQRTLRTSVSCPLHAFSSLAKRIHTSSAQFFPSFIETQNPSISSERFTIYFTSVHSLSSAMGFNDNRDFETLFFREKCRDNTYYARIIGSLTTSSRPTHSAGDAIAKSNSVTLVGKKSCTSSTLSTHQHVHTAKNETSASTTTVAPENVDIIFVGLSHMASLPEPFMYDPDSPSPPCSSSSGENSKPMNHIKVAESTDGRGHQSTERAGEPIDGVALVRKQTLWDEESQDFLSQWESYTKNITTKAPKAEFFQASAKRLDGVFALRWERKQLPRTAAWTSDALRSDNHVLGKLEVMIPWVLLTGDQCVEVGDLLSKQVFKIRT